MTKVNWAAKKKTGSRLDSPCGASRIGHSTPNLPRVESSSTIRKKQYHVETVKPASMCDSMRARIALHVFSGSQVNSQNCPLDSSSETGSREYSLLRITSGRGGDQSPVCFKSASSFCSPNHVNASILATVTRIGGSWLTKHLRLVLL